MIASSQGHLRLVSLVCCLVLMLFGASVVRAQQSYGIVDLGTLPGGTSSFGFGINSTEQVVGYSSVPLGQHGFLSTGGTTTDFLGAFHTANGGSSQAFGINNAGQIIGIMRLSANNFLPHGFLYSGGAVTDLGVLPGGTHSTPAAVNASAQVVGSAGILNATRAFLWQNGAMQNLGTLGGGMGIETSEAFSINDAGQVVGYTSIASETFPPNHAFLWQNGAMQSLGTLPGGSQSNASDINNQAQVVGMSSVPGALGMEQRAFLWQNGAMQNLGTLGGNFSTARSINDAGTIIGQATNAAFASRPFIYRAGTMTDLTTLLPAGHCWSSIDVRAINNDGYITGTGRINGQFHAFLLVPNSNAGGGLCGAPPPPPPPSPTDIISQMRDIVQSAVENGGIANSLDNKLKHVLNLIGDPDKSNACQKLGAFLHEVDAQTGKHLPGADAAELKLKAAQVAGLIGCN